MQSSRRSATKRSREGEEAPPEAEGGGTLSSSSALAAIPSSSPATREVSTKAKTSKTGEAKSKRAATDKHASAADTGTSALPHVHQRKDKKLFHDPIYRIMNRLPRSDVLEVVRCKFGAEHCERAAGYFDTSFMQHPLRRLKLQVGCSGASGLHLFFPRIFHHRHSLRTLDLSRNKLNAEDVITLCAGLGLDSGASPSPLKATRVGDASSDVATGRCTSVLELLDLSYNLGVGNAGAVHLMSALRLNTTIRAVQLISVGIDDSGAQQLAPLLRQRPRPPVREDGTMASIAYTQGFAAVTEQRPYTFFLNLNHNVIGALGTTVLGKGLPSHVSVTLCKQRLKGHDNPAQKENRGRGRRRPRHRKSN